MGESWKGIGEFVGTEDVERKARSAFSYLSQVRSNPKE